MIFEAASTRTRVSFENGFAELGGNALYLRPGEIHLPGRESIADTARTLSQYNAAIEIRSKKNETVNELAAGPRCRSSTAWTTTGTPARA